MDLLAGFDIGGTSTRCAIAAPEAPATILHTCSQATPHSGVADTLDCAFELLAQNLARLDGNANVVASGCVAPGMADVRRGIIIEASNLPFWTEVPLMELLRQRLPVAMAIANDVNAATLAEALTGAGRGQSPVVYVTISTGVAAGVVINGSIIHGAHYCAGEISNMIVERCCLDKDWGTNGCLELTAAGVGLAANWAKVEGGKVHARRAIEVFDAADAGDARAVRLIEQMHDYLAQAALAIATVLDPSRIILGGSIGLKRPAIARRMEEVLKKNLLYPPRVMPAALGEEAPMIGALHLAMEALG
ncbi:MAG: ROK family protein [Bacteroidota bacterium]|nr:ROK family protein [Bacteroidota bacterium]